MRSLIAILVGWLVVGAVPGPAAAQDQSDIAAFFAMMLVPYGALPSLVTPSMLEGPPVAAAKSFDLRFGRYSFDEDDAFNSFGLGGRSGPVGFTIGYQACDGCDPRIMAGVDFDAVLARVPLAEGSATSLTIGARPALGFGLVTGDGDNLTAVAAAVDVPVSAALPVNVTMQLVPWFAPGLGFGLLSGGGDSESGVRASLSAGVGLMNLTPGLGVNLAWRKVLIDEGPSTWGVGVSFGDKRR